MVILLVLVSNDTVVGLSAGSYYLSVEDANGCDTFTTVNVIEPQFALQGSVQIFGVPCKGDNTGMLLEMLVVVGVLMFIIG